MLWKRGTRHAARSSNFHPHYYIQHDYIYFAMTSTLIPIPENAEFWCNKLFYLHTPIVLTAEGFDTYCPLISTNLSGCISQRNGEVTVQRYECRLRKSKKGGKPPLPKDGVKERYGTTVRHPELCQVRIKVTRTVNKPITMTVERLDAE